MAFFENPRDARAGIVDLEEQGLEAWIREDLIDECDARTTFVEVKGTSDLGGHGFFDWLRGLLMDLDGEIVEAGYADNPKVAKPDGNVVPLGRT